MSVMIDKAANHCGIKVTFMLRNGSPIREPQHLIHLDALMAYIKVQESVEDGASDFSAQDELPLATVTTKDASHPVWAASALQYQPSMRELRYWSRKTDIAAIAQAQGDGLLRMKGNIINAGSGPWKQYSQFEKLLHVSTITAWCIGDINEVERLLSQIMHIGKRRSRGYGEVVELVVDRDENAEEKILHRVLTWPHSDAYIPMRCGTKPPYFETRQGFYPSRDVFANTREI